MIHSQRLEIFSSIIKTQLPLKMLEIFLNRLLKMQPYLI